MNHNTRPNSLRPLRHWIPLAALLLAIAPTQLHAGAWTQAPGGMYFKIAGLSFRSQDYLDAAGERRERVAKPSMEELSDESISAYLEYGLWERLTLVATLPYKRLVYKNTEVKVFNRSDGPDTTITRIHPDEIRSGLADLELRLRWRLLRNPAVVSLALGGKFPLGYDIDQDSIGSLDAGGLGLGLSPVDGADNKVPLGTGERDIDMRLLVGKSLYPLPGYLTSTVGYRKRGGAFSDEFFYGLEAGVTYNRLLVKGVVEGMRTMGDCGAMGQGGLVGDQDILKLAPGLIWSLSKNLEVGVDLFHIAAGCNTAAGTTYAVGLAFKR
ncbi:MAG: hypothetical protein OXH63_21285 [Gemmatimonadetes bacterium]|nr:hypothetical protein [Gemmatimonadota bacterium]